MTNLQRATELLDYFRLRSVKIPLHQDKRLRLVGVAPASLWDETDQVFLHTNDSDADGGDEPVLSVLFELVDQKSTTVLILLDLSKRECPKCKVISPVSAACTTFLSMSSTIRHNRTGFVVERAPILDWWTFIGEEPSVLDATQYETLSTHDGPLLVKASLIAHPRGPYSLLIESKMNAGVSFLKDDPPRPTKLPRQHRSNS
jgi:hypothetical protein